MWITTTDGFFSAVQHRDEPALLVVRTRVRADADFLAAMYADWRAYNVGEGWAPEPEVIAYEASDYPWRVIMPRVAWAAYLDRAARQIHYGNFKDAVKAEQGEDRARRYASVWAALLGLEDDDPQGRPRPTWDAEDWPEEDDQPNAWGDLPHGGHSTWGRP